MWAFLALCILGQAIAQNHIGEDHLQDHSGQPLVFLSMGDWGTSDNTDQTEVAQAMANYADENAIDFIVTTGDNFYDGVTSPTDEWFDTRWKDIYNIHVSLENLRWYITVGNHDYYPYGEDKEWNQVYRHPIDEQWYMPHLWYCLHFQNTSAGAVDIFLLDTQAMRKDMNDWEEQVAWLEEELAASTADWLVAVGHHPAYTIGNHALGSSTVRTHVVPLLEEYEVDMFLIAHDHNFQHLKKAFPRATDHVVVGTGGRGLYDEQNGAEEDLEEEYGVYVEYFDSTFGFGAFTFDQDGMHVDLYDERNRLVYTFTRTQ